VNTHFFVSAGSFREETAFSAALAEPFFQIDIVQRRFLFKRTCEDERILTLLICTRFPVTTMVELNRIAIFVCVISQK